MKSCSLGPRRNDSSLALERFLVLLWTLAPLSLHLETVSLWPWVLPVGRPLGAELTLHGAFRKGLFLAFRGGFQHHRGLVSSWLSRVGDSKPLGAESPQHSPFLPS